MTDIRSAAVQAREALPELIDRYWSLAYAEGKEGRTHDTEDGAAQQTRGEIDAALRAISAALAAAPAPMPGWKLVPVEPTEAMIRAAYHMPAVTDLLEYRPSRRRSHCYSCDERNAVTAPKPTAIAFERRYGDDSGVEFAVRLSGGKIVFECVNTVEFPAEELDWLIACLQKIKAETGEKP